MIRVLIIDDDPIFRRGLGAVLNEAGDIQVCGEGSSADDAVAMARDLQPHVVVADLPPTDAVLSELTALPGLRAALLTAAKAEHDVRRALAAGALGYLVKGIGEAALIDAVRTVANGSGYVAPTLAARLLTAGQGTGGNRLTGLTARETGILQLIAEGCSNKEIARRSSLQEKTVKHHVTRILQKLGVRNRTEAAIAFRTGQDQA